MVYGHTDLKKGVLIELDGAPHQVIESSHIAMGRGGAVMRTKLKNLRSGAVFERSFRASDKTPAADVARTTLQYLYSDDTGWHFMHPETYEQVTLGREAMGEIATYLVEGAKVIVMEFDGQPLGIDIGNNVMLKVVGTEPGVKGDTATSSLKPATTETGREVMVPLFINVGDVIKVDTRNGAYLERQK
jgi:elongation factor P